MSNVVKLILAIAFAIFVVGVIWAIVVAVRKRDDKPTVVVPNPQTPTLVGEPSRVVTPPPALTPPPSAPATPVAKPSPKVRRVVVITEEVVFEESSSAWASAGTNPDGSTFAEAFAK